MLHDHVASLPFYFLTIYLKHGLKHGRVQDHVQLEKHLNNTDS